MILFLQFGILLLECIYLSIMQGDSFDDSLVRTDMFFILIIQPGQTLTLINTLHLIIYTLLERSSLFYTNAQPMSSYRIITDKLNFDSNINILYMLSEQEIRSLVRMDDPKEEGDSTENVLDVSHQQLRRLKEIELGKLQVERVDASYNYFKDFTHLNFKEINDKLEVPIKWLDLSFNFFTRIDQSAQSAHVLQYLKYLNMSANRVQSVDFSQLSLPLLQVLNLNNNQLQYFLDCPPTLKVLTLNHNHLSSLAFTRGNNLTVLSATNNKIKKIGIALQNLLLLDLQSNLVDDLQALGQLVSHSQELLSINFRENPVSSINTYRVMLLENCPKITQIDEVMISPHIREGFKILKTQEKLDQMLDQANKKYVDRLAQKQKIKEELIRKMKEQQTLIEQKFNLGIEEERKQFQVLEKEANSILGKSKFNIIKQQSEFSRKIGEYNKQNQEAEQRKERINQVQQEHIQEYLQFLKKKPIHPPSNQSKRGQNLSRATIRPQFRNIVLFDTNCVDSLLSGYDVNSQV